MIDDSVQWFGTMAWLDKTAFLSPLEKDVMFLNMKIISKYERHIKYELTMTIEAIQKIPVITAIVKLIRSKLLSLKQIHNHL